MLPYHHERRIGNEASKGGHDGLAHPSTPTMTHKLQALNDVFNEAFTNAESSTHNWTRGSLFLKAKILSELENFIGTLPQSLSPQPV